MVSALPVLAFAVLLLFPRFVNVERRITWVRHEGARSGIFRFRGERLTTVAYADRFFF